ncbi:MAG: ABC transporter permease [Planctomycetota bacterium]
MNASPQSELPSSSGVTSTEASSNARHGTHQQFSRAGRFLDDFGEASIRVFRAMTDTLAILAATVQLALRPSTWTAPVRSVMVRQLLFTGSDAMMVTLRITGAVGIMVIVQAALWVDALGLDRELIEPLLWRGIVRELSPLLACLVVVGRSGAAVATELASMTIGGEIEVLDSQGLDPMTYLIMPRILAFVVSVFGLALIAATSMLVTGFVVGHFMGVIRTPWSDFLGGAIRQFTTVDLLFFIPKTTIAGAFAGVICCRDGMSVRDSITDVPLVSSRSIIRAMTAVFAVSAVSSVLIYGRLLVFKVL